MEYYSASVEQRPETIQRYSEIVFNTFYSGIKIAGFIMSIILVVSGGFIIKNQWISILMVFLGCILFTSLNAPARFFANRVISMFRGNFNFLSYSLGEEDISIIGKNIVIRYTDLTRLVEDEEYFYLFQSSKYGWMISKNSVSGIGDYLSLREYLAQKTKLKWERPLSIFNFNLDFIKRMKNKKDHYDGPRLGR